MKLFIIVIIAILYATLFVTTYSNLKPFNLKAKTIYMIVGIFINLIITSIVVSLNKFNIENENVYKFIKNIDILIFTAVNGIITMPTIAKNMKNYKMKIIDKNKLKHKTAFIIVTYFIIIICEVNYLKGLNI